MYVRIIALVTALALLVSCGGTPEAAVSRAEEKYAVLPESAVSEYNYPEDTKPQETPVIEAPADPEEEFRAQLDEILWSIETARDPVDILFGYFDLQYLGYLSLRQVDLRPVLDMTQFNTYNIERWMANLVQRRRLLYEENLCFVDTERYDYDIRFIEEDELNDIRMDFWKGRDIPEGEVELHFVVEGEPGGVYPPLMAVNSQHTVRMIPDGDGWKISLHFFPGAVRKYFRTELLKYRDDEEVLAELYNEFMPGSVSGTVLPAPDAQLYNGTYAARYAELFTESPNPDFYHVGDWAGNCMNFVSQCILHGFGSGEIPDLNANRFMTSAWFSGGGGGTFAWENVDFFWEFAQSGESMVCEFPQGPQELRAGDIVQTRSSNIRPQDDPDDFGHALLVVDSETLLLAQNTPACFVYYSDLVNTARRFVRPIYMK